MDGPKGIFQKTAKKKSERTGRLIKKTKSFVSANTVNSTTLENAILR